MDNPMAEVTAIQGIIGALEPLTAAQRQAVTRKIRVTGDAEIAAMERILAALKDVKGTPGRDRVIDWAMDAYKGAKTTRKAKAKDEKPAGDKDRTIDLRAV